LAFVGDFFVVFFEEFLKDAGVDGGLDSCSGALLSCRAASRAAASFAWLARVDLVDIVKSE
jgi:hypothetical protein